MESLENAADRIRILRRGPVRIRAREEAVTWVEAALDARKTLHDAAAQTPGVLRMEGRRTVYAIPTPGNPARRWVVRHSARGGGVAVLLGDRYLRVGTPRPFLEMRTSRALRSLGFRTPRVMAAAVYAAGIFRRGDLVTEYVPDAVELAEVLFDPDGTFGQGQRTSALRATGALVRSLAAAGVSHPDLNARNVLLQWDGERPLVHLIDLDRCRISGTPRGRGGGAGSGRRGESGNSGESGESSKSGESDGSSTSGEGDGRGRRAIRIGARMYGRLRRSLRKWESRSDRVLAAPEWDALEQGFREGEVR